MTKPRNPQRAHYNISSPSQGRLDGEPEESGPKKHWVPPAAMIRKWAMESSEGGRARCAICHEFFAMYYIGLYYVTPFEIDHVCKDCAKARQLRKGR